MNDKDRKIIEEHIGKFVVIFAEIGDYDTIEHILDTEEEANNELEGLQKVYPLHFGYVAKILKVVRNTEEK